MVRKNIIWVILDSIRSDRTPFGSRSLSTTPNLQKLSSHSDAVGTTCTSHGIWSQPSVASMMTGVWPSVHGVGSRNEMLPSDLTTIPKRLSNSGYKTVGLSTNPYFSPDTGLDRGFSQFDYYDLRKLLKESTISAVGSYIKNLRKYSAGFSLEKRKHSHDYLFNKIVCDKLSELSDTDSEFTLIAHYHGVHHPYYPSNYFLDVFKDEIKMNPTDARDIAFKKTVDPYETIAIGDSIPDTEWLAIQNMYDCLITQIDHLIGNLIKHIKNLGIFDNSIIVITSDHGDLLGEYNMISHKLILHQVLTEVPVVIKGSESINQGKLDNIQHIDIFKTILDEVGVDTKGVQGYLIPNENRGFTISQRGAATANRTLQKVREIYPEYEPARFQEGNITSVKKGSWNYVVSEHNSRLYKLPKEDTDVSNRNAQIVDQFESIYKKWRQNNGEKYNSSGESEFTERTKEHLSDLGYLV